MIRRALFLVLCVLAAAAPAPADATTVERLTIVTASGEHAFSVEIALTEDEREVGLMYRRSLAPDRGMLFDFGRETDVSMWMKNTYVPLDMVFLSADGRVSRVANNAEPLSTRIISSNGPAKYVVELAAGTAARIGIRPGDRVIQPRIGA